MDITHQSPLSLEFYRKYRWVARKLRPQKDMGFAGGATVKNPLADAGDVGSIHGSGKSPGAGNGNALQYSCLENPMDRGAWRAAVHGVAQSRTRLST